MAIPLATTTVTVTRVPPDATRDGYDAPPAPVTVASGIRATISGPKSRVNLAGGQRVVSDASFHTDPADIQPGDTLTDATSGRAYSVLWAQQRYELGLGYCYGDLRIVSGAAQ